MIAQSLMSARIERFSAIEKSFFEKKDV